MSYDLENITLGKQKLKENDIDGAMHHLHNILKDNKGHIELYLINFDLFRRNQITTKNYDFLKTNSFDIAFTSQSKFRSTILEEFMHYIFRDYLKEKKEDIEVGVNDFLKSGSIKAYTNLYFKAKNASEFINALESFAT